MSQTDRQRHEYSSFSHAGTVSAPFAPPPFVQREEKWRARSNTFTSKVALASGNRFARERWSGNGARQVIRLSHQWERVAGAPSQDPDIPCIVKRDCREKDHLYRLPCGRKRLAKMAPKRWQSAHGLPDASIALRLSRVLHRPSKRQFPVCGSNKQPPATSPSSSLSSTIAPAAE